MATIPTPETFAREILAILYDDHNRPGEGTLVQALRARFGFTRPGEDLQAGLDYAERHGWVNVSDDGFVTFTAAGFAQA